MWVVVLLAVNRYIAVCFPFKALQLCTISKVKKQLAFVLLSAVVYNIPRFAENRIKYVTFDNGTTYKADVVCSTLIKDTLYVKIYMVASLFTFVVVLPWFTLTYVNIRLIQALKMSRRKRMQMVNNCKQNDNNVTLMLVIVVVVFTICELPAQLYKVLSVVPDGDFLFYLRPVADMFMVLNSAVNFFIYVIFNKRFRHVLARTVGCCSVTEVDGRRPKSPVTSLRVSVVSGVTADHENDTDSGVEETHL